MMGGPVSPLFQARTELRHKFMSFSQKRVKGFRQKYEFEKRRIMIADSKYIQIFGYTHEDFQPYHIVTHCIDDTNSMQMGVGDRGFSPSRGARTPTHGIEEETKHPTSMNLAGPKSLIHSDSTRIKGGTSAYTGRTGASVNEYI